MTAESPPAVAPASPLMSLPGAAVADGVDAGVAAHYGNPLGEQRRLAEDVAFVDRSKPGRNTGARANRPSWLHSLTTHHLSGLPARGGSKALTLSPHGASSTAVARRPASGRSTAVGQGCATDRSPWTHRRAMVTMMP